MFRPNKGSEGDIADRARKAYEKAVKPANETGREKNKKYRIAWKEVNGHSGHGEYVFDEKGAHEMARAMNEKYKGQINHWAEREP